MAGLGQGIKKDLLGSRFTYLLVIAEDIRKISKNGRVYIQWLCLCDCGNNVIVTSKQLYRGQKSCGCKKLSGRFRKEKSDEDINIGKVISHYKQGAKKRKLCWELSFGEVKKLLQADCYYCGTIPSRKFTAYSKNCSESIVSGIDRIDSTQGYYLTNVVSCCKICNFAKTNMKQEDFFAWIEQLIEFNLTNT